MSFDWGSRPTDYGRAHERDLEGVYSDPHFSSAVLDAVRNAPTMHSTFPPASIDPRAVEPPQKVTVLPNARERYEGQEVLYFPEGSGSAIPVWSLRWDSKANGGAGSWLFVGGSPIIVVGGSSTTSSTSYTDATNSPQLVIANDGLYHVTLEVGLRNNTVSETIYIVPSFMGDSDALALFVQNDSGSTVYHVGLSATYNDSNLVAGTYNLRVRVTGGTGEYYGMRMICWPVELY